MTEQEIQQLKQRTNYELMLADPKPILEDLGIDFKSVGYDSYKMNIRGEKTASAFISLKNGLWKYKDFGNGNSGNIATVVMDVTGKSFKDALDYSLSKLGLKNYLDEALEQGVNIVQLSQADRERIQALKAQNKQKESSHALSRVVSSYPIETNKLAQEYLASRGIIKVSPQFKVINGEYTNKYGEVKKAYGVGVMTQNGGADIHFLKQIGSLKTMTFGNKDISFFPNKHSDKVAIFESKFDYLAAYQQMPLDNVNIVIANSTSNALKVADLLKKEDLTKNVMVFNQNDLAGYQFVENIVEKANINQFKTMNYDIIGEYKKDCNDLLLDGIKLSDRIQNSSQEQIKEIIGGLKMLQKAQNSMKIDKNELKRDSQMINSQNKTQGHQR